MGLLICEIILCVLVFFTGTCIFSFLNVVVYRVPKNQSFVTGYSMCPSCGHRLGAFDLVPVFSFLFLGGKCRYCSVSIGVRDTLVELLGGVAALICIFQYEDYRAALTVFAFFCVLTVVAFIDIDTMEIPDGCEIAILVIAVTALFTMPELSLISRLIGCLCVSVPMLLLAVCIPGAFGGGDIKLMAACGLFLGWKITLVSAVIAIFAGGFYGIYLLALKKKDRKAHFAFGPFLCAGMAIAQLWGGRLVDWYVGIML